MNAVHKTFIGLGIALFLASTLFAVLAKLKPQKDYTELKQRTWSWWVIVALLALALCFDRTLGIVMFSLLSVIGFREYLTLISIRESDRRVLLWAFIAIPIQFYLIWANQYSLFIVFVPLFVFLFLPFRAIIVGNTQGFLGALSSIQWGLMATVFNLGHVAYLLSLKGIVPFPVGGAGLALFLILLTELNDIFQYCSGKLLGRHKITPTVSPNKTVEGFVGGLVCTTILSYFIAPILTPLSVNHSIIVGLLISAGGFVGDVTISAVKRDLGVKDSGHILPGHGGILDRVDSLTYTAPIFFHFIRIYYAQ